MRINIREAEIGDIAEIQSIRRAVKENILSDPTRVTDDDCMSFITQRGKGWVAESGTKLTGFAIADLREDNIWALFVHPQFEKMGIGRQLHDVMLDWYFDQGKVKVWLSTDPRTRAAEFYRRQKWLEVGTLPNGEIKFEMSLAIWQDHRPL